VKLQRNALSVIEPPTGNEEDDDLEFENTIWHGSDMGEIQFGMLLFYFYLSKFLLFSSISIAVWNPGVIVYFRFDFCYCLFCLCYV
jgi:hypothetical protein